MCHSGAASGWSSWSCILTFTENVAVATGIHLNTLVVFLLTAAVNMFNWFDMFSFGMTETFYSWRASSYILYAEETRGQKIHPPTSAGLRKNIFVQTGNLYAGYDGEGVLSVDMPCLGLMLPSQKKSLVMSTRCGLG